MQTTEIITRFNKCKADRTTVDQLFELIERYVAPFRGEFFEDQFSEHQIDWRKPELYDSTAVIAAQILSSSMQGALTNPAVRWFQYLYDKPELASITQAAEWLQHAEHTTWHAIQNSNFNLEAAEFYLDLVTMGTSVMVEEFKDDEMVYTSIPIKELYFDEGHDGRVINLYREHLWSTDQIVDKFGDKNLPEKIARIHSQGSPAQKKQKHKVIFCIYKRSDSIKSESSAKKLSAKKRPYGYKYVLYSTKEMIGQEGGYYDNPGFVTRWRKTSRSQWGFSPATVCLADILTLNSVAEITLEALGKVVDPSTLVTEFGLLSDLDLGRGGLTVVRSLDDVASYESKARFDVGELKSQNLQEAINRAFFVDQLEMKNSPAMTASEVHVRYELMQRLLGPTLGRLQTDFLDPMLERTFFMLLREKKIDPIPNEITEMEAEVTIEYTGPLARSQRMDGVNAVRSWATGLLEFKELVPGIDDYVHYDNLAKGTGYSMGVPSDYVRSDEEVKQIREQREVDEKARREAELAKLQGDAKQSLEAGKNAEGQTET